MSLVIELFPAACCSTAVLRSLSYVRSQAKSFRVLNTCSQGVVHNNLNSSNIFVGYDGVVKIADCGTPHVADNSQFTHTFQSPEVASHPNENYDNKGNVWSLSVIVLEMGMGQLPSDNDIKIMSEEPGNNVGIPEDGDRDIPRLSEFCSSLFGYVSTTPF